MMSDDVLQVESLDLEARGVSRRDGKVVFIEGALPSEHVTIQTFRRKPSYEIGRVEQIRREASIRVKPRCEHFGMCGGCVMQHLEPGAQVAVKQRALEDALLHIGKARPERMLPALHGPYWGYRYRARLAVRWVAKKNTVLVGFHERKSSFVADIKTCHVLPPHVAGLLMPLRALIMSLSAPDRFPQIEVSVGESATALVLRHLMPLTTSDVQSLREFADLHKVQWWLQSKGPDTVMPLDPEHEHSLHYTLPEFGLRMPFKPTDFTQVNHQINRALVSRALMLLEPQANDRIADMFCGLGNFTLALATLCHEVLGIEGSEMLTARAETAAKQAGIAHAKFQTLNLFEVTTEWLAELGRFDRMLIDPPREGALALAQALSNLPVSSRPTRIVYVSCNPATLARDTAILLHEGNYKLRAAGVVNMFPHTGHVESMAVFES
jgi:23S rRNA (uracil1939-C5)-methyltransferase